MAIFSNVGIFETELIDSIFTEPGVTRSYLFDGAFLPSAMMSRSELLVTIPYQEPVDLIESHRDVVPETVTPKYEGRSFNQNVHAINQRANTIDEEATNVSIIAKLVNDQSRAIYRSYNRTVMNALKGDAIIKVSKPSFQQAALTSVTPEEDGVIVIEAPDFSIDQTDYKLSHDVLMVAEGVHNQANMALGQPHAIAMTALEIADLAQDRNGTASPGVQNYTMYTGFQAGGGTNVELFTHRAILIPDEFTYNGFTILDVDAEIDDTNGDDVDLIRYITLFTPDSIVMSKKVVTFEVTSNIPDSSLINVTAKVLSGAVRTLGRKVVQVGLRRRLDGGRPMANQLISSGTMRRFDKSRVRKNSISRKDPRFIQTRKMLMQDVGTATIEGLLSYMSSGKFQEMTSAVAKGKK